MILLDCTLRDGGYYNGWDFPQSIVCRYLEAMQAAQVDIVELGLRSLNNSEFKGACAYSTDSFLERLPLPPGVKVGVMINAAELIGGSPLEDVLERLFPSSAKESPVDLVRIASHVHEFEAALPAVHWLKGQGYMVGFNLMQVADCSEQVVTSLARKASDFPLDALYFADSMGSMTPEHAARIIGWLRSAWHGPLGIHTHDNMGLALSNTLRAMEEGVTWLDSTVTGMGRGPGNARTEELAIELAERRGRPTNLVPLMALIREYFTPLQSECGWGTNPYYYLSGKYGIHPTYIQEMLSDSRYDEEDILGVIEHLRVEGGKKYSSDTLDAARHFYHGQPQGFWSPRDQLEGREVLLLGSGPGVAYHREALEQYIVKNKPIVLALNTQSAISADLINFRAACHPVRLLADCEAHTQLPQPLITPYSMLPEDVKESLGDKEVLDYGLRVSPDTFEFEDTCCSLPTSLVVAYALAIISSGRAHKAVLAGFDGYSADDPRTPEMRNLFARYQQAKGSVPLLSITPTKFDIPAQSVYAL